MGRLIPQGGEGDPVAGIRHTAPLADQCRVLGGIVKGGNQVGGQHGISLPGQAAGDAGISIVCVNVGTHPITVAVSGLMRVIREGIGIVASAVTITVGSFLRVIREGIQGVNDSVPISIG